jgi:DNA-binding CsgD family transcriptional regulator
MTISQQHICMKSTEQVRKLLKPITGLADIHYFCYGINYPDTSGFTLVTDAPYYESWFKSEGTLRGFYLKQGWHWIDSMLAPESKQAADERNIANIVTYIRHYEDKSIILEFGATPKSKNTVEFYLNHQNILKRFGHYFEEEAANLIRAANEERFIPLAHMVQKDKKIFTDETPQTEVDLSFLKTNTVFDTLSEREEQCYKLLIQGYSYEEISQKLALSSNTVNTYFHRIKTKLGCGSKLELVQKANDEGFVEFYF